MIPKSYQFSRRVFDPYSRDPAPNGRSTRNSNSGFDPMQADVFGKPIRDQELLRRIEKAKSIQRANDPHAELHDPIEDNPRVRQIVREVERRAEKESMVSGMGRCHDVWGRMERILKTEHGIIWYPPSRMNTDLIYD